MRPECVAEIAAAIGRQPTARELAEVEGAILTKMRETARTEPKWAQMTGQQRLQVAAELAQQDALAAAEKTAQRRASNVLAQAREGKRLAERADTLKAQGRSDTMHKALFERMRQVDDYAAGVRNEVLSDLVPAIEAIEPKFFGLMDDPANVRAFARAVMDGDASDPKMARAAKVYTDKLDALRERSNAAGTDIGKLDYGYLPQPHDTGKVARAGADAWVRDVLPKLRRERYVKADGTLMDDVEVESLLRGAFDTIATEGRNKLVAGQARVGSRASRFDDAHRVLHFKDADAYLDYLETYGRGTMLGALHGHIGMMAKSVAMMEELGANPNATFRLLRDLAVKGDNVNSAHASWHNFATVDMVWDTLNGTTAQPVNPKLAQFFQGVRNFTTAAKLQGVMLSAITDAPLQVLVAKSSGVPFGQAMKSLVAGFGSGKRELAHHLALGMDEVAGEMARWHQDFLAQGWTAKLANTTMKLTLVEGWTNALRRGYALTLSGTMERLRRTNFDKLGEFDRRRLSAAGVTPEDWAIWQKAEASPDGLLTKDGIRAVEGHSPAELNRAVARYLGFLDQEGRTAVLSPDIETRAMVAGWTKSGTVPGELVRSMMLFKSFALGIVDKHLRRIQQIPTTQGRVAYSVSMMAGLTAFGAISTQLKDLAAGKDPRDMTTGKFWGAAFLQGGGIGVFGDVLYTGFGGNSRGGQPNYTSLAGPVFGNALDFLDLTLGNASRAASGKKTDVGADAVRFARSNAPLVNLWYLRAIVDHMLLHDLQEQVSPGYLRRMKQRAKRDWNQDYWWTPGEKLPDRAPNLEAAAGGR